MRTFIAIAVVGTLASTAHARIQEHGPVEGQPKLAPARGLAHIYVGAPGDGVALESTSADIVEVGDTALVQMSLALASQRNGTTARVALYLPAGARVVGMSYTQGGEQVTATTQAPEHARRQFEALQRRDVDPALLEGHDGKYTLSVFPMSSFERTTATVSIAMPRFRRLIVDGGTRLTFTARNLRAPTEADVTLAARPAAVDTAMSLYAAPAAAPVAHAALRPVINATMSRLRGCYTAERRHHPVDLVVNFAIDDNGEMMYPRTTGGSRDVNTCVTEVAKTWRFHAALASKGPIDYRLHFTP